MAQRAPAEKHCSRVILFISFVHLYSWIDSFDVLDVDTVPPVPPVSTVSVTLLQVAGAFLQQYEVYYKRLDPEGKGEIGAMQAASFLKKSGLPDDVLGKVRKPFLIGLVRL